MKTCLICGAQSASNALTCPNCGEGSWSETVVAPKPADVQDNKRGKR